MKGTNDMSMRTCDSVLEAAVEMLDAGISEEALPMGLAPLFDPDPFNDGSALTWRLH
jgi:hypothetical protein